jgi:hypothetical protein
MVSEWEPESVSLLVWVWALDPESASVWASASEWVSVLESASVLESVWASVPVLA